VPELPTQPHRLQQLLVPGSTPAGSQIRKPQVAYDVRHQQPVVQLRSKLVRALEQRLGGRRIVADHLVVEGEAEQRLRLTPDTALRGVERHGPLEQLQLARVRLPVEQELRVQQPAAGQREIRLDRVQHLMSLDHRRRIGAENGVLVKLVCPVESIHAPHVTTDLDARRTRTSLPVLRDLSGLPSGLSAPQKPDTRRCFYWTHDQSSHPQRRR
jgi:hypothetical protein